MVITPRLGLQPRYIGLSVVPTHIDYRPLAAAPIQIGRLVTVAAAVSDASIPFVEAHRESAHREGLRKRHTMLRTFEFSAALFAFRRAHGEDPRRDHHHLGALAAILEDFARFISAVWRRIGECSRACANTLQRWCPESAATSLGGLIRKATLKIDKRRGEIDHGATSWQKECSLFVLMPRRAACHHIS